tara:strand:+ start:614 stop:826 length:213 start_codon:yes stop_codon:yes gene_type:complete
MHLTNLIHSLQDVRTKINFVYSNSEWDSKENTTYLQSVKEESIESLNTLITDLTALQRERVGLEIGAWRA